MKGKTKRYISKNIDGLSDEDAFWTTIIGAFCIWLVGPFILIVLAPDFLEWAIFYTCWLLPIVLLVLCGAVLWCAVAKRTLLTEYRRWQNNRLFVKKDETDE